VTARGGGKGGKGEKKEKKKGEGEGRPRLSLLPTKESHVRGPPRKQKDKQRGGGPVVFSTPEFSFGQRKGEVYPAVGKGGEGGRGGGK